MLPLYFLSVTSDTYQMSYTPYKSVEKNEKLVKEHKRKKKILHTETVLTDDILWMDGCVRGIIQKKMRKQFKNPTSMMAKMIKLNERGFLIKYSIIWEFSILPLVTTQ